MKTILAIALLLIAQSAGAHGDHPPKVAACKTECTKEQIESAVPVAVQRLIEKGRIQGSWSTAIVEKVEKKDFKKGPEWVAVLNDANQKDLKMQKLYVFITTRGYLNGSNFTGE